jgi:hypothetical protein
MKKAIRFSGTQGIELACGIQSVEKFHPLTDIQTHQCSFIHEITP